MFCISTTDVVAAVPALSVEAAAVTATGDGSPDIGGCCGHEAGGGFGFHDSGDWCLKADGGRHHA